jgi:predicted alpha/beta-fold hydrolase
MNREHLNDDLIDLGVASVETKGGHVGFLDSDTTLQPSLGLMDD